MNSIQSEVYTIMLHLNDERLRNPDLTEKSSHSELYQGNI